jgi:hypothetical protein
MGWWGRKAAFSRQWVQALDEDILAWPRRQRLMQSGACVQHLGPTVGQVMAAGQLPPG